VNRREFIALLDDDHTLDDFKNRLSRGFGVQIRVDLQVRAEIVIQADTIACPGSGEVGHRRGISSFGQTCL
jgi:hypothetical protein